MTTAASGWQRPPRRSTIVSSWTTPQRCSRQVGGNNHCQGSRLHRHRPRIEPLFPEVQELGSRRPSRGGRRGWRSLRGNAPSNWLNSQFLSSGRLREGDARWVKRIERTLRSLWATGAGIFTNWVSSMSSESAMGLRSRPIEERGRKRTSRRTPTGERRTRFQLLSESNSVVTALPVPGN